MNLDYKKNVLMLSPFFYPHCGGVEKHVYHISKELIKLNYRVTVITTQHEKNLDKEAETDGIKIFRFKPNTLPIISTFINIIRLFKYTNLVSKSEIVHCHDYQLFIWFLGLRLIFPFKKVFITFHGWEGNYPPKIIVKIFRKVTETFTSGNICIGKFIESWYGTKASIIRYGAAELVKNHNKLQGKSDIIVLSRISKDVPIKQYLESFRILKEKYNNKPRILFLGEGNLDNFVREYSNKKKLDISLIGFVNNPFNYINSTSIVITNGYLATLEAALYKKPVFAIYQNELEYERLASFPYANDFISLSKDSDDLAQKLHDYLSNNFNYKFEFTKPHKWALNQTWQNLAKIYITLWNE